MKFKNIGRAVIAIIVVIILIFISTISSTFFTVHYGSIGIVTRFGALSNRVMNPGLHVKIPYAEDVIIYRTQKITYETSDNSNISDADYTDTTVDTTTKDGQQVFVRYTIRFSIDPEKVVWIASNIGTEADVVEKIIKTESRVYVRNIVREFEAESLYTGNIKEAQTEITNILTEKFEANGIILDSFGIRQIQFQPDYLAAIEDKQIEKEKVITEQYKAEQEEFRKQQAITKAQGEAEAQRLQQQTLSSELIQKLWIEKWDGKLPTYSGNSENILLGLPQ